MTAYLQYIAQTAAPYQQSLVAFASVCAFLLMFAATYSVSRLIRGREAIRRRALDTSALAGPGLDDRRNLRHHRFAATGRLLSSVTANLVPDDQNSVSAIRKALVAAGHFQPSAVTAYYAVRLILAAGLPAAAFLAVKVLALDVAGMWLLGLLILSSALGLLAPRFYIGHRRKALQQQCRDGFPDFMDLMVVCAEAGISMGAAIQRVGRELAPAYPYLGACLHLSSLELRAGRSLGDTFEGLANRVGIQEAYNLGSLLKQSMELGTSLSHALRVYSEEMRDKRMSAAEEKAHALPAKMSVPLTLFVFPVILVVILLPVFIRMSSVL